jgi:branched-chain amino acid transport system substrate-binding protein
VDSATLIRELGADAHGLVISQVVPHPARATLPLVREYLSLLRAKGGSPSYASMEGYIAARILGEGLKRVGPNPTREKLVEALENLGNYDMDGLNLRFSPTNHNGGTYIDLTIINAQGKLLH